MCNITIGSTLATIRLSEKEQYEKIKEHIKAHIKAHGSVNNFYHVFHVFNVPANYLRINKLT